MISCGVDIVLNTRFEKLSKDKNFLEGVFHNCELVDKNKLASIFALKEACMKAIGKKLSWKDIEISYDNQGKPIISLSNDLIEDIDGYEILGSVSHDGEYTIAFVILSK